MKYLGACSFFIFAIIAGFINAASVSAETISVSHKITITASVAPAHYVIIDEYGSIIDITSNTAEDVTPRIFLNSVKKGNERPLTKEIYAQYREIVPLGQGKMGHLYKKGAATQARLPRSNYLLPLKASSMHFIWVWK